MDSYVVFYFLPIMTLVYEFVYKVLFEHLFSILLGICPRVESLSHGVPCLTY